MRTKPPFLPAAPRLRQNLATPRASSTPNPTFPCASFAPKPHPPRTSSAPNTPRTKPTKMCQSSLPLPLCAFLSSLAQDQPLVHSLLALLALEPCPCAQVNSSSGPILGKGAKILSVHVCNMLTVSTISYTHLLGADSVYKLRPLHAHVPICHTPLCQPSPSPPHALCTPPPPCTSSAPNPIPLCALSAPTPSHPGRSGGTMASRLWWAPLGGPNWYHMAPHGFYTRSHCHQMITKA